MLISFVGQGKNRLSIDGTSLPHPLWNINETRRGGFRALAREAHAQYGEAEVRELVSLMARGGLASCALFACGGWADQREEAMESGQNYADP